MHSSDPKRFAFIVQSGLLRKGIWKHKLLFSRFVINFLSFSPNWLGSDWSCMLLRYSCRTFSDLWTWPESGKKLSSAKLAYLSQLPKFERAHRHILMKAVGVINSNDRRSANQMGKNILILSILVIQNILLLYRFAILTMQT